MAMDFPNAQLPRLLPLAASFAENAVEADLKRIFIDLFNAKLAATAFDANVLGAAHLGSLDLVRNAVNMDGLVLLQGDREEAATRYLYRAWKSGDVQGRGIHFLRTYLQLLFPGLCEVEQLWQDKALPYPKALYSPKPNFAWWLYQVGEADLKLDGTWGLGRRIVGADESRASKVVDTSGMFLTSRIEIALDFSVNVRSIVSLMHIIRSVIPARLLPIFRFWLRSVSSMHITSTSKMLMEKRATARYPWCGRVITSADDKRWKIGIDGRAAKLPQQFGAFKLGKLLGEKVEWQLKNCRTTSQSVMQMHSEAWAWRVETIPSDPEPEYSIPPIPAKLYERLRRVDGSWTLAAENRIGRFKLNGTALRTRKMHVSMRLGGFKITDHKLPVLLSPKPARLTLSGSWKLGGPRNPGFEFAVYKEH